MGGGKKEFGVKWDNTGHLFYVVQNSLLGVKCPSKSKEVEARNSGTWAQCAQKRQEMRLEPILSPLWEPSKGPVSFLAAQMKSSG